MQNLFYSALIYIHVKSYIQCQFINITKIELREKKVPVKWKEKKLFETIFVIVIINKTECVGEREREILLTEK